MKKANDLGRLGCALRILSCFLMACFLLDSFVHGLPAALGRIYYLLGLLFGWHHAAPHYE